MEDLPGGDTKAATGTWYDVVKNHDVNGVFWQGSLCTIDDIRDGTSNTYLIGEKYLNPKDYETGEDGADNESMFSGWDNDNHRTANGKFPYRDRMGFPSADAFGSAHAGGFNVVLCDGSVRAINYSIDVNTHSYLGSRSGGEVVDASKL